MKFTWEEIVAGVNAVLKSCTYDELQQLQLQPAAARSRGGAARRVGG